MTTNEYHAYLWDMAGPEYRINVCRVSGASELLSEFKWTDIDETNQKRISNAMSDMQLLHKSMNSGDQND